MAGHLVQLALAVYAPLANCSTFFAYLEDGGIEYSVSQAILAVGEARV
jgi:hypothetical protein